MIVTKRPAVCSLREIPFLRYAMLCIHRRVGRRRGRVPLTGEKDMAFTDDQLERYSRHLILKEIGVRGQKKLLAARVLGSPAALYLAAAGVGTIGIVDDDVVDLSNLQRQIIHGTGNVGMPKVESAAETVTSINPDVTVKPYHIRVSAGNIAELIAGYDVIVDAADNFSTKFLINDACVLAGKPYIYGGALRFEGQLMTYVPGRGPCYRCIFRDMPAAGEVPSCKEAGVLGAVVGVIGSMQAVEAVKLILGVGKPLTARLMTFDALAMTCRAVPLPEREPDCPVCGEHPTITTLDPARYIQPACGV